MGQPTSGLCPRGLEGLVVEIIDAGKHIDRKTPIWLQKDSLPKKVGGMSEQIVVDSK